MTLAPPLAEPAAATAASPRRTYWKPIAWASGILAAILAVATPLLPVRVDQTVLTWPQGQASANVTAPLVSYSPISIDAQVPCRSARALGAGGILFSTLAPAAPDREKYGLTVGVRAGALEVIQRDKRLLSVPLAQLSSADCLLTVRSDASGTEAVIAGAAAVVPPGTLGGDMRPQLTGLFTEAGDPSAMRVTAELDSRFTSTPSVAKQIAITLCVLLTLLALFALHKLDSADGRRSRRFLPARWRRITLADLSVASTLLIWHVIGATTADDGYQFVMGRTAADAGYLANYFRYWGVPETPVGTPLYNMYGWLAAIWPASIWVRLPSLLAGLAVWFVLSREVTPRLGRLATGAAARWAGALVFLAMWLPFNNGLRPEPIVALGTLLTWCSVERAIATRRVLPLAVAVLIAALTFTAAPSALITLAVFAAAARPITHVLVTRARIVGWAAVLAPVAASGLLVLVVAFADQTLAAMLEMQRAHVVSGPNLKWFDEYTRYQWLLLPTADGSVARRFGVLAMGFAIFACIVLLLRFGGRIPGVAAGPAVRITGSAAGAVLLMSLTPTKWTHQFGVFAGLAGAVAVAAGAVLSSRVFGSRRTQLLVLAPLLLVLALSLSGPNGWWYVSHYGVPWFDIPPSLHGRGANSALFWLAGLALAGALWLHLRAPYRVREPRPARTLPLLAIAAGVMVAFEVLSFATAAVRRYPAYSVAKSSLAALTGDPCGFGRDVLVEPDPGAGLLVPATGSAAMALAGENTGFAAGALPGDLTADDATESGNGARPGSPGDRAALPFGLDPATPVRSNYAASVAASRLSTGWFRLPPARERGPLLVFSAAGRYEAGEVTVELASGTGQSVSSTAPIDIGPAPSWRNLRVPLASVPAHAELVRLAVNMAAPGTKHWLAVTPPRVPVLQSLDSYVGRQAPVLLDWVVGLQFPCQRPFSHRDGVAEIPQFRILPDRSMSGMPTSWEGHSNGGPLGWIDQVATAQPMAAYLNHDWSRDWGELQKLIPNMPPARPAQLAVTKQTRSGWWMPGRLNTSL